jgi:hypothetical protein
MAALSSLGVGLQDHHFKGSGSMSDPGYPIVQSTHYEDTFYLYETDSGNVVSDFTYSGGIQNYRKDKGGVDTPGWPNAPLRNNPYWVFELKFPDSTVHLNASRNFLFPRLTARQEISLLRLAGGADEVMNHWIWPVVGSCRADSQYAAVNKLASNVQSSRVNLLQAYAEREQVANLVASTARKIADSVISLRRGNFAHAVYSLTGSQPQRGLSRGIKRRYGGIPEQWLALQYGWKPLLSDVYGSCEELARTLVGRNCDAYEAIGTGKGAVSGSSYVTTVDTPDFEVYWDLRSQSKACVTYQVLSEGASFLDRTGITNPLLLGWELLPWSFVVDWFYPVGTFLENLNFSSGLGFNRGYCSSKVEGTVGIRTRNENKRPFTFDEGGWTSGSIQGRFTSFERNVYVSWPAVHPPQFKDPFSPTHVANALSLLASAFSSGRSVR